MACDTERETQASAKWERLRTQRSLALRVRIQRMARLT